MRRIAAWVTCFALTVGAFALLTGCATVQDRVYTAAATDGATTVAGLALGAAEANPLGLAALVLKVPVLLYADSLPDGDRDDAHQAIAAVWGGATVNNLCVLAAIASGGAFGPACIAAGVAYAVYAWRPIADVKPEPSYAFGAEVAFWTHCAEYKRATGEAVRCTYRIGA